MIGIYGVLMVTHCVVNHAQVRPDSRNGVVHLNGSAKVAKSIGIVFFLHVLDANVAVKRFTVTP